MAKQILKQTKSQLIKDDFFQEVAQEKEEDQERNFTGVERETDDLITRTLQQQILQKKQMIFDQYADKILSRFQEKQGKLETITLKGHKKCITCLEISPNLKYAYSASKDKSIIKWDLEQQKKIFISLGSDKDESGHTDQVTQCTHMSCASL